MIDVHVGILLAALTNEVEENAQGGTFGDAVMRPDRGEHPVGAEHPEQVFQPPPAAVGRPQRVAFEVEEHISGAGRRKSGQRLRPDDLVGRHTACGARLQAGLGTEGFRRGGRQPRDRTLVLGQLGDGGDAGVDEPAALGVSQTGDQQDVVGRLDLGLAVRAAQARAHAIIAPPDRPAGGVVAIQQVL